MRSLRVESNLLAGKIPHQLFEIPHLLDLSLGGNGLTGTLIGNVTGLTKLSRGRQWFGWDDPGHLAANKS